MDTRTFFDDTHLISVGEKGFSHLGTDPLSYALSELIVG